MKFTPLTASELAARSEDRKKRAMAPVLYKRHNDNDNSLEERRLEARMIHLEKIVEEGKRLSALLSEISARHDVVLGEVTAMMMAEGRAREEVERLSSLVAFPSIIDTDKI